MLSKEVEEAVKSVEELEKEEAEEDKSHVDMNRSSAMAAHKENRVLKSMEIMNFRFFKSFCNNWNFVSVSLRNNWNYVSFIVSATTETLFFPTDPDHHLKYPGFGPQLNRKTLEEVAWICKMENWNGLCNVVLWLKPSTLSKFLPIHTLFNR